MKTINLDKIEIGNGNPLVLIAGPCVVENEDITFQVAESIKEICTRLNIPYIFKSSYKKANRTSIDSFVTLGIDESLAILDKVKHQFNLKLLTDVHTIEETQVAAEIADILQIPAFLCRQTDLLVAASETGKIVYVKKGQFLAPEDMRHAINKIESTGNKKIMLTERGTTFGYHNLVVDMRSLVVMKNLGYPVVMDATHAVQMPSNSNTSGGNPEFIRPLAKAATAIGIDALFLEVHPDPPNAKSDAGSQLRLDEIESLLMEVQRIDKVVKEY
jgi:2-dehydro-3-deoxyphosphooctonate aldolase (KDO 8-P synthase)